MKITLRPPCRECPFLKKAAPGWLGPDSPEYVFAKVHSDDEFGYPCHMDAEAVANHDIENDGDGSWREDPGSVEQCVGAMLHAKKTCKRYDDKMKQAGVDALAATIGTDSVLGIEFIAHHKGPLLSPRKKK